MSETIETAKQPNALQPEEPTPKPKSSFNRRQFFGVSSAAAAFLAMPAKAIAKTTTTLPATKTNVCQPEALPYEFEAFCEPHTVMSQNGIAKLEFDVYETQVRLKRKDSGEVEDVKTRTYNGQIPGPTISLNPGDRIEINLRNYLPPNQGQHSLDCPSDFNTTNLHFHGLHVSPNSLCDSAGNSILSSDDVIYKLDPSTNGTYTEHPYCVWLPKDHAPGTHWYHSHLHGSTAIQVSNGMLGAIIIKEPHENKIVDNSDDKVFVMQEIVGEGDASIYCQKANQVPGEFLINGILRPTITVQRGKIQRWRFINGTASPRGLMQLRLVKDVFGICDPRQDPCSCTANDPVEMNLIAVDGISFYGKAPQPILGWDMSPGNRADFLVKLTEPGLYKIFKDAYSGFGNNASVKSKQILAYVYVPEEGPVFDDPLPPLIPGHLPRYLWPIQPNEFSNAPGAYNQDNPREIAFSLVGKGGQKGGGYYVNSELYDPDKIDVDVELGSSEVWRLTNIEHQEDNPNDPHYPYDPLPEKLQEKGYGYIGGSPHPFHIHVNPFQLVGDLIDPNGPNDSSNWRWWDTIAVEPDRPNNPEKGKPRIIWNRFSDYPGAYVFHCHILIHEDRGMMQNVRVKPTASNPGIPPCTSSTGEQAWPPGAEVCEDYLKLGVRIPPPNHANVRVPDCDTCETPSSTKSGGAKKRKGRGKKRKR